MPLVRYKLRRDTAANWTSVNPTLGPGEPGVESDTRLVKYGDGITDWIDLPYAAIELPAVLTAYAAGDTPSAFTLSIVDSADGAAWLAAIGAQPENATLTEIAEVSPIADGEHTLAGIKITTAKGLITSIDAA